MSKLKLAFPIPVLIPVLLGLLLGGCAAGGIAAGTGPAMLRATTIGTVLADRNGMTLYTLDSDPRGASVCVKRCARGWPPLRAAAAAEATGEFSIIRRPDGELQWAFKGKPLYGWVKDKKPGDVTGEGVGDVWRAARP